MFCHASPPRHSAEEGSIHADVSRHWMLKKAIDAAPKGASEVDFKSCFGCALMQSTQTMTICS
eukprot:365689-Amphidinium_carterae.3